MNAIHKGDGHSTKRMTILNFKPNTSNVGRMGIPLLFAITMMFILPSCQEKSNGQDTALKKKDSLVLDSENKPQVDIKVNHHYDEAGNLIGFDSTYSSYYSNIQGDTIGMDTLFNRFDSYFKNNHSLLFGREFNDLFFRDTLLYPDFFHNDFFLRRYEMNDSYLKSMMQRMDSVKNNFYHHDQAMKKKKQANP